MSTPIPLTSIVKLPYHFSTIGLHGVGILAQRPKSNPQPEGSDHFVFEEILQVEGGRWSMRRLKIPWWEDVGEDLRGMGVKVWRRKSQDRNESAKIIRQGLGLHRP